MRKSKRRHLAKIKRGESIRKLCAKKLVDNVIDEEPREIDFYNIPPEIINNIIKVMTKQIDSDIIKTIVENAKSYEKKRNSQKNN